MEFMEYQLTSDALCMGEKVQGGIFRPCDTKTIRYSLITGALRAHTGILNLHAAGYLEEEEGFNESQYLVYSPQERMTGVSKVPITVQFITNVWGKIYIPKEDFSLPKNFTIAMGALKSRGFGRCQLQCIGLNKGEFLSKPGQLRTRIPLDLVNFFDIRKVITPNYGYLFRPTSLTDGHYVLSLFEGSLVAGPKILVKEAAYG